MEFDFFELPSSEQILKGINFNRVSTLYNEIANSNFKKHNKYLELLTTSMSQFFNYLKTTFESQEEALYDESITDLLKYSELSGKNKSNTDIIADNPEKSLAITKLILQRISFNKDELKDNLPKEEFFYKTIKKGVIAISFEAFACESIINEELLKITSKNQLNKISKNGEGPKYINKLYEICKRYNYSLDRIPNNLIESIEELMSKRNKIVHIKEYKYDFFELLAYYKSIGTDDSEHISEYMYVGELIYDIQKYSNVYEELEQFLLSIIEDFE